MRDAVGALRAVTEALKELTLCGYMWASLLLTPISGSLDYSRQAQSPVISTTELVGKLWPGQMKLLAQGCGAIPRSARHLIPTIEGMGSPYVSISFLCPSWVQLASQGVATLAMEQHPGSPKVRDSSSSCN